MLNDNFRKLYEIAWLSVIKCGPDCDLQSNIRLLYTCNSYVKMKKKKNEKRLQQTFDRILLTWRSISIGIRWTWGQKMKNSVFLI